MKSSESSSRARSLASLSSSTGKSLCDLPLTTSRPGPSLRDLRLTPVLALLLLALAACNPTAPAEPGETPEYLQWRADFLGTDITSNITGGAGTVPLVVDFVSFPLSKTHDQWIELGVNGSRVHRYWLDSPDGRPLQLQYKANVRNGLLSVKAWYTGKNTRYSCTGDTKSGTHITFTCGGPDGVGVTQTMLAK